MRLLLHLYNQEEKNVGFRETVWQELQIRKMQEERELKKIPALKVMVPVSSL